MRVQCLNINFYNIQRVDPKHYLIHLALVYC